MQGLWVNCSIHMAAPRRPRTVCSICTWRHLPSQSYQILHYDVITETPAINPCSQASAHVVLSQSWRASLISSCCGAVDAIWRHISQQSQAAWQDHTGAMIVRWCGQGDAWADRFNHSTSNSSLHRRMYMIVASHKFTIQHCTWCVVFNKRWNDLLATNWALHVIWMLINIYL